MKIICYQCEKTHDIDDEDAFDSWTCEPCLDEMEEERLVEEDDLCEQHEIRECTRWSSVH